MSTNVKDRDWTNLPNDILHKISSKLPIRENMVFGKVCSSWRSVKSLSCSHMPYLLYFPRDNSKLYAFYNDISDINKIRYSKQCIPYLRDVKRCIGHQDGWLIIRGLNYDISIFNPITAQQMKLPPMTTPVLHYLSINKAIIVWPCNEDVAPLVVVLFDDFQNPFLAFALTSDDKWDYRARKNHPCYKDICCIDGDLFGLCNGKLYSIKISKITSNRRIIQAQHSGTSNGFFIAMFLVNFGGELLLISTHFNYNHLISDVIVEKLDLEKHIWVSINDLGDSSLFLGRMCSFSVSAKLAPGLKKNLLYFHYGSYEWSNEKCKIAVFNMEDRSCKTYSLPDPQTFGDRPIWFAPSLTMLKNADELK